MKIECIRTHHLQCKLDKPFGFSQWSYAERNVLLVEVITEKPWFAAINSPLINILY